MLKKYFFSKPYISIDYNYKILDDYLEGTYNESDLEQAIYYISRYGENTNIQKYINATYNQYDAQILAWTNYWNNRLKERRNFKELDPNLVKAVMYQESKMGTFRGRGNGVDDPMQVLDKRNPALQALVKGSEGTMFSIQKGGDMG